MDTSSASSIPTMYSENIEVSTSTPEKDIDIDAVLAELLEGIELADEAEQDAVAEASAALTLDTQIDTEGTVRSLLSTGTPGFHKLKKCPLKPNLATTKASQVSYWITDNRKSFGVICRDPSHGHSDANLDHDANGHEMWKWKLDFHKHGKATLSNDDDLTVALDFKSKLHRDYGLLAVDPTGELRHYVAQDCGKRPRDKGEGTWRLLDRDRVQTELADRMKKLSVTFQKKNGETGIKGVDVGQHKVEAVYKMLMTRLRVAESAYLDKWHRGIPAKTRFDLRTGIVTHGCLIEQNGTLRPAVAEDHVLEELSLDIDTRCDGEVRAEWDQYLSTFLSKEETDLLGMWLGAVVVGQSTRRLQKAVLIQGAPGTGKSTLGKFLASIVPARSQTSLNFEQLSAQFTPAQLYGKLLNFYPETNQGAGEKDVDVGKLKTLFDASTIVVEHKHKQPFSIEASCAHLFCANRLPRVGGEAAVFQRILLFEVRNEPFRDTVNDNKSFFEERKKRWGPAILAYALEGLKALSARSWKLPKVQSVQDALDGWQGTQNPVLVWVRQLPKAGKDDWVLQSEAVAAYNAWALPQLLTTYKGTTFGNLLTEVGVGKKNPKNITKFNIKLPSNDLDIDLDSFGDTTASVLPKPTPTPTNPTIASVVASLPPEVRFALFGLLEEASKESADARQLGDTHAIDRVFSAAFERFSSTTKF